MVVENRRIHIQLDIKETVEKNLEISQKIKTGDSITEAEYTEMMTRGLAQAKEDNSLTLEETLEAFKEVEEMKKDPFGVKTYDCFLDIPKESKAERI
ncbi:MAG: hypothetical protein IJN54_14130 [Lachnospiraceae bacterium]|nr:hypothetical protein [Lachnospiraceae bacterium]